MQTKHTVLEWRLWILSLYLLVAACGNNPANESTAPVNVQNSTEAPVQPEAVAEKNATAQPIPSTPTETIPTEQSDRSLSSTPTTENSVTRSGSSGASQPKTGTIYAVIKWRGLPTINDRAPTEGQPITDTKHVKFDKNSDVLFVLDTSKATYIMHPDPFEDDPGKAKKCANTNCGLKIEPSTSGSSILKKMPPGLIIVKPSQLEIYQLELKKQFPAKTLPKNGAQLNYQKGNTQPTTVETKPGTQKAPAVSKPSKTLLDSLNQTKMKKIGGQ